MIRGFRISTDNPGFSGNELKNALDYIIKNVMDPVDFDNEISIEGPGSQYFKIKEVTYHKGDIIIYIGY